MSTRARKKTYRQLGTILLVLFMTTLLAVAMLFVYIFFQFKNTADSMQDPKYSRTSSAMRPTDLNLNTGQPVSMVLFGLDSDEGRAMRQEGRRSDTIILATLNPQNQKMTLLSVPRDTQAEIVGHGTTEKINHAYAYGGPKMAIDTLEKYFNMPIDYYASVDMDDFVFIIDNIGGINVVSPHTFTYDKYHYAAGETYRMNGKEALAFARSRKETGAMGDEGRQVRQQVILNAITKKLLSIESVPYFNEVLKTISHSVTTNVAFQDVNKFRKYYAPALGSIEKLSLNGTNEIGDDGLWYFIPSDEAKDDIETRMKNNLGISS
ncbi:LCP family protein [Macrococcus lamae]|uniref:LytR family transcriptional regulator n=1 Tax=Macrococcus lamae TaxID=198484 RepID=A0A4R6BW11_9STAP|nr:LCP family protein [Macrococcus lamae]TDM12612.1 LytR family transcriptional regulator [Macrococcus lamae]